jgi:hypothetical protein
MLMVSVLQTKLTDTHSTGKDKYRVKVKERKKIPSK